MVLPSDIAATRLVPLCVRVRCILRSDRAPAMPVDLQRVQSQRAEYETSWQARQRRAPSLKDDAEDPPDDADSASSSAITPSTTVMIDQALEARATVSRLAFQLQQRQRSSSNKKNQRRDPRLVEELGRAREVLAQKLELLPNWIDWEVVVDQEEDSTGDVVEEEAEEPNATADSELGRAEHSRRSAVLPGRLRGTVEQQQQRQRRWCRRIDGAGMSAGCGSDPFRARLDRQSRRTAVSATNNITWYDLPATLPRLVQQQQQHIPSWKVLLERQYGSLLWDRQLPQVHLLQCSSSCSVGSIYRIFFTTRAG